MNPPVKFQVRQSAAQGAGGTICDLSARREPFEDTHVAECTPVRGGPDVCPSQYLAPDPLGVGRLLGDARAFADLGLSDRRKASFRFNRFRLSIDCAARITPARGSLRCAFFLSSFFRSPVLALRPVPPARRNSTVARVMVAARPSVPSPAHLRPISLTRTPLPARQSALVPVRWPTTQGCATDLTAAFGRTVSIEKRPSGADPRVVFCISAAPRPGCGSPFKSATRPLPRGAGGEPCSTRS